MKTNITIIVPTYKRPASLKKLINSLNTQIDTAFKLVIVNDDPDNAISLTELRHLKFDVTIYNNRTP